MSPARSPLSPYAPTGIPPSSVLVVVTRRIGDVLLATPLIRSIKCAWPSAAVDVLIFEGTQGVISGNPDIRRILTIPPRPRAVTHLAFVLRLLRRYEIAVSLVPGDRPTLYAWLAGRWRTGLLLDEKKERWKRAFLDVWVPFDDLNTHTVLMHLALADVLGIPPLPAVRVTWQPEDARTVDALLAPVRGRNYVVLHPYPKFNYKMWREQGWIELAGWLTARGLQVVVTGSGDPAELSYVRKLASAMDNAINLAGRLSLGALGCLLSRAALYVGPDTVVTHMAAAIGAPTVALFGPSNPVKWGPWPREFPANMNPWVRSGSQRRGNVALVTGTEACVPCLLEGCERHVTSYSDCLQNLPVGRVIAAAQQLLASSPVPA